MHRTALTALLIGASLACSGCGIGLIYTNKVEPLTTDFHATPRGTMTRKGDIKSVRYYVEVQWDKNAIGAIAKRSGMDEVYYADLETFSILGYFTQRWVRVYGRKAGDEATTAR